MVSPAKPVQCCIGVHVWHSLDCNLALCALPIKHNVHSCTCVCGFNLRAVFGCKRKYSVGALVRNAIDESLQALAAWLT